MDRMTVDELRGRLRTAGQPVTGIKEDLVRRLSWCEASVPYRPPATTTMGTAATTLGTMTMPGTVIRVSVRDEAGAVRFFECRNDAVVNHLKGIIGQTADIAPDRLQLWFIDPNLDGRFSAGGVFQRLDTGVVACLLPGMAQLYRHGVRDGSAFHLFIVQP